jgi:hypothetical protein
MSKIVNLPIAKVKDVPEHLKTFLKMQDDGTLPPIPLPTRQEIKEQATRALLRFLSVPGLVTKSLTEEEKPMLAPIEVWAYNQALAIQQEDCDFNTGKYIADLVIGPPVQKTERMEVTGDIKDWQNRVSVVVEEMAPRLEEAIRIEKEKHERANTAS